MTAQPPIKSSSLVTVTWFEGLLVIAMVLACVGIGSVLIDKPALGLDGDGRPYVDAEPAFPVDVGDRFSTIETDDDIVDAATGQEPVEFGKPITARFTFMNPTTDQRVIWVIWQITGPLLVLGGLWLVYSVVRSARLGDPFIARNERLLWKLAVLIAGGGTGYSMLSGFAPTLMLQRSAAADLTERTFTLSFLPIIAGLGVAVLASVWHVGIALQDDVEGTI